ANITLSASDVDGQALTYAIVVGPAHGTLTTLTPGSGTAAVTYTPNADYSGSDSFTFKASDGTVDSNVATVTIAVAPQNDAPVAKDDAATTEEDTAATIVVLRNDSDADGDTLTVSGVSLPAHGTASANADGTIVYTPAANYNGADGFSYTIA